MRVEAAAAGHLSLVFAAVSFLSACDGPLELTNDDRTVVVPERYRACSEDDDCTLVSISCDSCCERDAVTKALQEEFEVERRDSCSGYSGAECDCQFAELEARCNNDRCVAAPLPADEH